MSQFSQIKRLPSYVSNNLYLYQFKSNASAQGNIIDFGIINSNGYA